MADIRTTSEEFETSGSLANTQKLLESTQDEFYSNVNDGDHYETFLFLRKKIDELIKEVNILKNS